jgi:hypothetical protein
MSQIQGTNLTSAEALEEDGYTNVLNEEMRDDCDNNGYCDDDQHTPYVVNECEHT